MAQKFTDNGRALLTASIASGDTSLTVEAAKADRFPVANTTDWFKIALIDSSGNREVVRVNTRTLGSGVMSNLVRAQDGTTALAFTAGSVVILPLLAADFAAALANQALIPTGGLLDFAGGSAPAGFLGCDGSAVSRTTYAALFVAIGTVWGAGDGTTTFNLPDFRGRSTVGAGSGAGLTARTLGAAIGAESVAIGTANLPAHNHAVTVNDPGHAHGITDPGHFHTFGADSNIANGGASPSAFNSGVTGATGASGTNISVNAAATGITATTANTGSGTALNVVNPGAVVLKIIKT